MSVSANKLWQQAAANNAAWCDAMLRSHGRATSTTPHLWQTSGKPPLYYPHAVTLGGQCHAKAQYADIARMTETTQRAGRRLAIKDSFTSLDLAPLGYEVLFSADWLCLSAGTQVRPDTDVAATWQPVHSASDLQQWELAWHGAGQAPGTFLLPLLAHHAVTILAGYRDGQIVAGCSLYRSESTVGYTNLFMPTDDPESWRKACIAEIARRHPDCPLIGYESDTDSMAMQEIGCRKIGSLQVWQSAG